MCDGARFMTKEITFKASFSYTDQDFAEVVNAFGEGMEDRPQFFYVTARGIMLTAVGRYKGVEKMATSRTLLDDVVEKGFKELISNKDDHIKILVTPRKENLA